MHILERFVYETISHQEITARYPDEAIIIAENIEEFIEMVRASL